MILNSEKVILFNNKEECCGCSACEAVCPLGCIEMRKDYMGFLYPQIDYDKCSGCGKCVSVCPFKNS